MNRRGSRKYLSSRRCLGAVVALLAVLALACTAPVSHCEAVTFTTSAQARLDTARAGLSWEPIPPCAYGRGFTVADVQVESRASDQRLTFVVQRRGDFVFLFSQADSVHRSPEVPAGSSRVALESGAVIARGFEGPTRAGDTMLYLRWDADGRIFEFQGTLGPVFGRTEAYRAARSLIALTAP